MKNRYLLLLFLINLIACKNKPKQAQNSSSQDSTEVIIDTLVSDVNWTEESYEDKKPKINSNPTTKNSSGARGGAADNELDVEKYRNLKRDGDKAEDFAKALIYPAIRMVYSDNFAQPKAKVLKAESENGRQKITVALEWKDHWVPNFKMQGILEINQDGSDVVFTITTMNTFVEALEFTEDNFKTVLKMPTL